MRTLLLSLALLSVPALAKDPVLRAPVEVPLIGFKAVLSDGQVLASWKRYKRDDFASYRLVKSDSEAAPVYPDAKALFTGNNAGDTEYADGLLTPGTWHYRLCVVTRYGDRWVSPVVTIAISPEQAKRSIPTAADFEP